MADIGLVGRSYVGQVSGAAVGSAIPFPGNNVGRRIAAWAYGTFAGARSATRAWFRTAQPERLEYYHPRREGFIEDAAMSRAMDRL